MAIATSSLASAPLSARDRGEARAKLRERYHDIRDVNFGSEGITMKATKDGREWPLAVDSTGKMMERR
jgi:hypothetical protein